MKTVEEEIVYNGVFNCQIIFKLAFRKRTQYISMALSPRVFCRRCDALTVAPSHIDNNTNDEEMTMSHKDISRGCKWAQKFKARRRISSAHYKLAEACFIT